MLIHSPSTPLHLQPPLSIPIFQSKLDKIGHIRPPINDLLQVCSKEQKTQGLPLHRQERRLLFICRETRYPYPLTVHSIFRRKTTSLFGSRLSVRRNCSTRTHACDGYTPPPLHNPPFKVSNTNINVRTVTSTSKSNLKMSNQR